MDEPTGRYARVRGLFGSYWHSYGGVSALVRSPYLHVALVLTVMMFPVWWDRDWWGVVIQILPNIIGFSIGGYAVWLGFGDEKFKALIAGQHGEQSVSPYMELSATFCHFVVVQLTAIVFAIATSAMRFNGSTYPVVRQLLAAFGLTWSEFAGAASVISGFFGFFLFMYAMTTALAAVFAIFEVGRWFDSYRTAMQTLERPGSPEKSKPTVKQ